MSKAVHITKLAPGDVVRIAMKAGRHLEPVLMPRSKQTKLLPGRASAGGRSLRAKNYSRTTFLGFITQNDTVGGKLTLQVEDRSSFRVHLEAIVPYKDIRVIQKFITPAVSPVKNVTIGAGPSAQRRPGSEYAVNALKTRGFLNLIRVFF